LPGLLPGQLAGGQLPQLVIHQRQQLLRGVKADPESLSSVMASQVVDAQRQSLGGHSPNGKALRDGEPSSRRAFIAEVSWTPSRGPPSHSGKAHSVLSSRRHVFF
jgi:hypothetical protein